MSLPVAIWQRLTADPTLVALLATYGGEPAIVVGDMNTLPEDITPPFIIIDAAELNEPFDTKTEDGREVSQPIRCYTDATGSTLLVDQIAERVRALLHRRPDGLAEGAWRVECSGPIIAPTDTSFYGREVTPRVTWLAPPATDSDDS